MDSALCDAGVEQLLSMKHRDLYKGLTKEDLRSSLTYDKMTGKFFHKRKINQAFGEAGWVNPKTGYRIITVKGHRYMAHRLAWFYAHGKWPKDSLDHINTDKDDNRICNLREATDSQNRANIGVFKNNKLGIKGVQVHDNGKFRARIWDGKRHISLGLHENIEDAKIAYASAANKLFGEFARTS